METETDKNEPGNKPKGNFKYVFISIITMLGFLMVWQMLVITGLVSTKVLATPLQVVNAFIVKLYNPDPGGATLLQDIAASLAVAMSGFISGILVGVPLGLLMGWSRGVDRFFRPIFEIFRPIPPVAWIPLMLIWFGFGLVAKAAIIFLSALIPCVLNSYAGIKSTNEVLIDVAKTCGASNVKMFWRIGIPSAYPLMFAGIRIALGNSWGTLVAAEMLAANAGLGYMILMGRQYVRPDLIVLGMIVIGLIGFTLTNVFEKVEKKVLFGRGAGYGS